MMFPNMKMKIQRHTGTPWKELQERFIGYEPVIGKQPPDKSGGFVSDLKR